MENYGRKLSFFIFFFNLFAVTSIQFEKKTFKISKTVLFKNLLLIPFIHFFLSNPIAKSFNEVSQTAKTRDDDRIHCTVFSRFIFYYFMIQYRVASCIIVYVQIFNQKKIIKFLNNCVIFAQHYGWEIDFKDLCRKTFKILIIALLVASACFTVQYMTFFTLSWMGFIEYLIFLSYGFIIYLYSSFVCLFLKFLGFLFEDLTRKLHQFSNRKVKRNTERLFQQFIDVDQLMVEFKDAFGSLFSVLTMFSLSTATVKVPTSFFYLI